MLLCRANVSSSLKDVCEGYVSITASLHDSRAPVAGLTRIAADSF